MLTTHSREKNIHWNLPPSEVRQHFIVRVPNSANTEISQLLQTALSAEPIAIQQIEDVYYDTKGFELFSKGYACCIRQMLGRSALCLIPITGNGANDTSKSSLVADLTDVSAVKKLRISGLESSEVKSLLVSLLGEKNLQQQFRVRTKREHFETVESTKTLPFILDRIKLNNCHKSGTMNKFAIQYDELVVAAQAGDKRFVSHFHGKLLSRMSLEPLGSNAYQRAIETDTKLLKKMQDKNMSLTSSNRSGHDLFRAHMKTQLAEFQGWEQVAIEGKDEEGVHQMRVSIRRIRAALKTFAPLLVRSEAVHWHTEFRWLARRLGGVRDLDVFTEWLESHKTDSDELEQSHITVYQNDINELYHHARQGLLGSLDSERYRTLLKEFSGWIDQEQCFFINTDLTWKPTNELSEALVKRAVRRIDRKIKPINKNSPAEQLHRFRVECKRTRYSLDMLEHTVDNDHKPLIAKLKLVQEILGDHQDASERSKRIRLYANGQNAGKHGQDFVFFLGTLFAKQQPILETKAKAFFKIQESAQQAIKQSLRSKSKRK